MSRAPCAGALYRWKVNLFPETRRGTLDFIVPQMYPPNSSDLNLVDYAIWSVMQQCVYQTSVQTRKHFNAHVKNVAF